MSATDANGPEIRELRIDDYGAAHALWRSVEGVGLSSADTRDAIDRYLRRNPGQSLIARDDEKTVGTALCGNDGRRGYIHHLCIAPTHRRRGLARRLVEACVDRLRADGIEKCHVFVLADNESGQRFWRDEGWAQRDELRVFSQETQGHSP